MEVPGLCIGGGGLVHTHVVPQLCVQAPSAFFPAADHR